MAVVGGWRSETAAFRWVRSAAGFHSVLDRIMQGEKNLGISPHRVLKIACAVELGKRYLEETARLKKIVDSADIFSLFGPRCRTLRNEHCWVVGLNTANGLVVEEEVARGGPNFVDVQPTAVYRPLVRESAAAAVLIHNHPSGNPKPSDEDLVLTARLCQAGAAVGIPLIDHIIIANQEFTSLREWGFDMMSFSPCESYF